MLEAGSGLHVSDYAVIVLYFAAMVAVGAYFSGRQKSSEEYFVAGRRMPWLAVGVSLFAALTSTISYLAVPGETIRSGIAYSTGSLVYHPFALAFVFVFVLPFFMRLRLVSAYEYLERRFDYRARAVGSAIFLAYACGWMAMVVLTCSKALAEMTGWPLWAVLVVNGLVSTLYTVMGGMRAVIWTDVAQAALMIGGGLVTLVYVGWATETTPADWWADASRLGQTEVAFFSWDPRERVTTVWVALNSFFWAICMHGGNQLALQRYFTTPSAKAARRTLVIHTAAEILLTVLLVVCGLALASFYARKAGLLPASIVPTTPRGADAVFPYFIGHQLPAGIAGGVVAALFAAAMSTIASGVNSMATVFTLDFYRRWRKSATSDTEQTSVGHWFTAASGVAITGLAFALDAVPGRHNIMDMMPKGFNCLLGPLGAMFFVGMFLPRCTSRSAIPATMVGAAVGVLLAYWEQFFGTRFSLFWVIPCSCVASFVSAAVLGLAEWKRQDGELGGLTWRWRTAASAPEG